MAEAATKEAEEKHVSKNEGWRDRVQEATACQSTVINGVTIMLQMLATTLSQAETAAELKEIVDTIYSDANALANAVAANTPAQGGAGEGAPATSHPAPTPPAPPSAAEPEPEHEESAEPHHARSSRKKG